MGNRGILHDAEGRLGAARWRHPHWICCRLQFRGRRRRIIAPGSYTELFFLDEAVALAAGHRPCAECRRADYDRFLDAWEEAFGARPRAAELDRTLHAARIVRGTRRQVRFRASAAGLPDGVFVLCGGAAHLVLGGLLRRFSPEGYGGPVAPPREMDVLTPRPVVEVLRAGYRPELHESAFSRAARPS